MTDWDPSLSLARSVLQTLTQLEMGMPGLTIDDRLEHFEPAPGLPVTVTARHQQQPAPTAGRCVAACSINGNDDSDTPVVDSMVLTYFRARRPWAGPIGARPARGPTQLTQPECRKLACCTAAQLSFELL